MAENTQTTTAAPKKVKPVAVTETAFEMPKFEMPKFDIPKFETPAAFREIAEKSLAQAKEGVREVIIEEMPVERRIQEILEILHKKEALTFKELFKTDSTRRDMIITFLAVLELIRMKNISVQQSEAFGEIWVRFKPEPALKEASA